MKCNPKDKQNISTYHLKQQFISLLSSELEGCSFDIVLGFESSMRDRVCTLKFLDNKKLEVCVNIGFVQKSVNSIGCSFTFKLHYCALFVAEYIKLIEQAKANTPLSYFEGLVYLNSIEVLKTKETQSICSPLSCLDKKAKRSVCIRPIEISSAINTLNKLRIFAIPLLNKQDIATITSLCNGLLLYSGLPEIAYIHTNMPIYAMVHSFKKLGELLAKNPEITNEFPTLSLAPFDRIESLTTNDLFRTCIQSDNAFLIGVAIRLVAFLRLPYGLEIDNSCHRTLVDAMKLYIEYSVSCCIESFQASKGLLKDNSFAIRCAVKNINNYLTLSGIGLTTGNIHSIE